MHGHGAGPVVGSVATDIGNDLANVVLNAIASAVESAASWLLNKIGSVINQTTSPDLKQSWYTSHFDSMLRLAAAVVLLFLFCCAVQAIIRQDPSVLIRAVVVQLPLAAVLTGSAVQLVGMALSVTDYLSKEVSGGSGQAVSSFVGAMVKAVVFVGPPGGVPAFLGMFVAFLVVIGGFLVWMEMVVRAAGIDAATLFLPIALATMVWPAAAQAARRLVEVLAALILSKFVIVAIMALGASAITSRSGFPAVVTGTGLLLLATLSPMAILRIIPLAEMGTVAHLAGAGRRGIGTAINTGFTVKGLVSAGAEMGGGRAAAGNHLPMVGSRAAGSDAVAHVEGERDDIDNVDFPESRPGIPARRPLPAPPLAAPPFDTGGDSE